MRRYPLADLLEATGMTEAELSRSVGIEGTTLKRARERGFTADAADRYAVRAGFAAIAVWPDYGFEESSVTCVECDGSFVPFRKGVRFCSRKCSSRNWKRERYRTDPEFRARQKAQSAAYATECRRGVAIRHRAWQRANVERIRKQRRAYYLANRERILAAQWLRDQKRRAA